MRQNPKERLKKDIHGGHKAYNVNISPKILLLRIVIWSNLNSDLKSKHKELL